MSDRGRWGERESQGNPRCQHDLRMMWMIYLLLKFLIISCYFSPIVLLLSGLFASVSSIVLLFPLFIIRNAHFSILNSIPKFFRLLLLLLLLILAIVPLPVFASSLSLKSGRRQVSRTLLCILGDFNSPVVSIVSILPLIYGFLSFFCKSLETIQRAPTTSGITGTFIFHSLFKSLARSRYLSRFSLSIIIIILLFWEFFTLTFADGFSLEFEW